VKVGSKRGGDDMEVDVEGREKTKKGKHEVHGIKTPEAGLSEQPCREQ
jgi:hypothetical protein